MYTIDNISLENYGLYISTHSGQAHLPEPKEQIFTVYGKEGYQITKRTANELDLRGFIVADDLTDFIAKAAALRVLFSASGLRTLVLDNGNLTCFAKDGFKIENVRVQGTVIAKFEIKLMLV